MWSIMLNILLVLLSIENKLSLNQIRNLLFCLARNSPMTLENSFIKRFIMLFGFVTGMVMIDKRWVMLGGDAWFEFVKWYLLKPLKEVNRKSTTLKLSNNFHHLHQLCLASIKFVCKVKLLGVGQVQLKFS